MPQPNINLILEEIGRLVWETVEGRSGNAFLYAEAGDAWQAAAIFEDLGNRVVYYDPSQDLFGAIERLWEAEEESKKWRVMKYSIIDGKFSADFDFDDEIDLEESEIDRRERALKKLYGDKPVFYPPPPEDDQFSDLGDK